MKNDNRRIRSFIVFVSLTMFSVAALAQEGGIGGAVSRGSGVEPIDLTERMIASIADRRNQEALALMTGKALSDFERLLSNDQAPMEKIIPQDWRVLGEAYGESDSERKTLVQMKLDGEWAAFWFSWTKMEGGWKFSDSEMTEREEDIYRLIQAEGSVSSEPAIRSTVDEFFTALRQADIDKLRAHIVWDALKEFDDNAESEDFAQEMEQFKSGVSFSIKNVRIPATAQHLALVNYDVTVAGDPNDDEYMLLLNSGDSWRVADIDYEPDDFEENLFEFAAEKDLSVESFAVGSHERAVFLAFEKIMEAFVAVDTQVVLDMTTGEAHESFIKMIGDEDGMSQFSELAPSYRYKVIDMFIDPSDSGRAVIKMKYAYGDQEWDEGEAVMVMTGGVWKMVETK